MFAWDIQESTLNDIYILTKVSEKLNQSLPALLIGNIITPVYFATPFQIVFGVHLRDSKVKAKSFHDFR